MDARDIRLPSDSFDIAFGVAVLEHLNDIDVVLSNLFNVTKPGGHVYLQGAPIWTCHIGHHLWVNARSGYTYRYKENNPVENWSHLLLDRGEMGQSLVRRGCSLEDAADIVEWIYGTNRLNRYTPLELRKAINDSEFEVVDYSEINWRRPDRGVGRSLSLKAGIPVEAFSIGAIACLLRKAA
jgi:ubiquinone/menaquinone biosynthesis C-methylase UbiE